MSGGSFPQHLIDMWCGIRIEMTMPKKLPWPLMMMLMTTSIMSPVALGYALVGTLRPTLPWYKRLWRWLRLE